ncbi:hypothetical protein GGQ88_001681 [Novosphingobium hassiacum]|uniref:Uncharacterized protein n=1 Tax=Novosphingobium hassiacum TaxID=173676 RepID=A0A7W5ZZA5_9SPHN|nr:hypothetical protein [Novosphingobium hassiacum]MBB3860415.1 hypothetical protein [Novosphingobium hassiacum]
MRIMVAPYQWYSNQLLVGVCAAASDGGTLINDMGLDMVIAHFEGTRVFIESPSIEVITDANGIKRPYYGWWIRLRHDGRNGHAQLYFEGVAKDPSMQRRVIGPFQFSPQASLFSHEITIAATPPEIVGSRYKTMGAALSYLRTMNATNPRLTFIESGTYNVEPPGANNWSGGSWINGYVHLEATVPVTLGRPVPASNADPSPMRPTCGLHIKGRNITVDFANCSEAYHSDTATRLNHWFDGCIFTNSRGRYDLFRKISRSILGWIFRAGAYVTECEFRNLWNAGNESPLVRGCTFDACYGDLFTGAQCVIYNRVNDFDSSAFRLRIPSISINMPSGGTLERTGNTVAARVNGSVVGSFTLANALADFNANTNYTNANVVNWVNGLAGWSATLLDDTRAATLLAPGSTTILPGTWAAQSGAGGVLILDTMIDIHSDWYQRTNTAESENIFIGYNYANEIACQLIFIERNCYDWICINNTWRTKAIWTEGLRTSARSVLIRGRHQVFLHNTVIGQIMRLSGNNVSGADYDAYCVIANNVADNFEWSPATAQDSDLRLADNHFFAGYALPALSVNTSQGGTEDTLFPLGSIGKFAPGGALLTNLKVPRLNHDQTHAPRATLAPAGALS